MENMKRAISFLLALVLVLGMMPGVGMTAGAEEVETIPEASAAETTGAPAAEDVIPEEETAEPTQAPAPTETETTPAETTQETAAPQETTVPQQTAPAETEETPEEAQPGETLAESEDAADAAAAPVKISIQASKKRTYLGDTITFDASISPSSAIQDYDLVLVDEEGEIIEGDEDVRLDNTDNSLVADIPGTYRVCAVAARDETVISDPVKVTFVDTRIRFNLAPISEDYLLDLDGDEIMDAVSLRPGLSLELGLMYQTNETGDEEDWVTEYLVKPNVRWERSSELSEEFVSITEKPGDSKTVFLMGKKVTGVKSFTLKATDYIAGKAEVEIYIFPNPEGVSILHEDAVVNGETYSIDLGAINREEYTFALEAAVVPAEAVQKLTWTSSNGSVAKVSVVPDTDGREVTVTVGGHRLTGISILTAACEENPELKATYIIKTTDHLQQEEMAWDIDTLSITDLVAGKSVTLKAMDVTDPENPVLLTSDRVEWSINDEGKGYATISEDGVLTARDVDMGQDIEVFCKAIDNEDNAWLSLPVTIRPKANYVNLLDENGSICNDKTLTVNTLGGEVEPFFLDCEVLPLDDGGDRGALQKVTWSSSNESIAKVDPKTGKITWKDRAGTVTIKATATDGSKKSASVKITFDLFLESLEIQCPVDYVRSGESVRMDRTVFPPEADSVKLTWSLADGDEKYATISSGGTLKVKSIYEERTITVLAEAEGYDVSASTTVDIRPAKDEILTLMMGDACVTKTTQNLDKASESIQLTAYIVGRNAPQKVTWKYSSMFDKVSDDGNGTAEFELNKTGTGTITATATVDGVRKSATVTVKGIRKTASVEITEPDKTDIAAGQSLTLKAKLYDDEDKKPSISKVKWSLAEEDSQYASISSSGKLTAKATYRGEPVTVTVTAAATDGSDASDTCEITVHPKATGLVIQRDGINAPASDKIDLEFPGEDTIQLTALAYPQEWAIQDVKWTSSNKKVAKIDQEGEVTLMGTGTATIKASARDGSGKTATLKLTVRKSVYEISFEDCRSIVAGGKSLTLKPKVLAADGKKPSETGYSWKMEGDISYVKSFKNGVLKTKAVDEPKFLILTAISDEVREDGSQVSSRWFVGIYPKTTAVHILDANGNKVGSRTLPMRVGDTLELNAISEPMEESTVAAQIWEWSSSSKSRATVEGGFVTANKAGTVTIKAKAVDGSGKYDTVKIKILKN